MSDARTIALDILNKVQQGHFTLDHWLDVNANRFEKLNIADRSLSHALIFGVLRWQRRLDWMIDKLAKKSAKIDPPIRNILRIGLFQLFQLDRIPVSAAVNTSVDMVKKQNKPWAAGFVNGLLRRAATAADQLQWPTPSDDPVDYLAITQSFPRWMIARWIARWGFTETEQLCRTVNSTPTVTLRTNTLKITHRDLLDRLAGEGVQIKLSRFAPEGIDIIASQIPIMRTPGFDEGLFQIQDQGAQLVALAAAPKPGQQVWDACSGLGTKSAHMAQLMENRGSLLASDVQPAKLDRLRAQMQRLGVRIVKPRTIDLENDVLEAKVSDFDCILVDAPCSGTGVLQRNPDAKWRLKPEDYKRFSTRQATLLDRVSPYVKTGGTIVYAVCSFEAEENSTVIKAFLQKHPNFVIQRPEMATVPDADLLLTPEGFLYTLPHRHGMDGFFAAVLKKTLVRAE